MSAVATAGGLPTRLGKYEIIMPLAVGGMARIYIGRTTGIGSFERHVVLKMITPEKERDQTAVFMFLDEARLAASLNHQNVAQVFEVGEEGGIHYLAMEYVHGQDLRSLLAKAGSQGTRVPLELGLTVVAGAAAGLNHAHERRGNDGKPLGIVHRDVSPSNIMVGYDGAVKMLDFGIAKATSRSVETQSGIIKGKFAYMAPEQCRGREVDRRSDVFSLGIILYEITTQHRCFRADSDFDTMHRIVTGDVVRPTRLVQGYPQALEAIVMKALAVDANQRYQSAGALLEAIESYSVSARMSLSTMSLGRFMRDMFGDQLEPWLNNSFNSEESLEPKEATVSSTNGTGGAVQAGQPRPANTQDPFPTNAGATVRLDGLASASLEFPTVARPREAQDDASPDDAWNAPSLPPPPRPVAKPPAGMPVTAPMRAVGAPQAPPLATNQPPPQPLRAVPQAPFSPPGFGQSYGAQPYPGPPPGYPMSAQLVHDQTGPVYAHPGLHDHGGAPLGSSPPPSTRHGYASAVGGQTMDYPRPSQPTFVDAGTHAERMAPNRRPLLIGLLLAAIGMVVLVGITIAGSDDSGERQPVVQPDDSDDRPPPAVAPPSVPSTTETNEAKPIATNEPARPPVEVPEPTPAIPEPVSIKVDVESEPPGADVLLAGKVIGTTPLHTTLPRGAGRKELVVHKAGFVDSVKTIDLDENVTTTVNLKKVEERKPTQGTRPPPSKKPTCQNPAQVDPFDPRPVCK